MPEWLYVTVLFGIGPAMALGVVGLYYWNRRREDREAWERGQALRRQIREQQARATSSTQPQKEQQK